MPFVVGAMRRDPRRRRPGLYRWALVLHRRWVLLLLALSCLAAATAGSVVVYQRAERRRLSGTNTSRAQLTAGDERRRRPPNHAETRTTAPALDDPTLEALQPGDVVVDGVDDWLIVGTVTYREESDRWSMHLLEGGQRRRCLEVRARRGDVEVAFVDVAEGLPGGQLFGGLTFGGQSFQLEGRGDARTTRAGTVEGVLSDGGTLEWARYGAAGGGLLLVEDEGPRRRGFIGQRVPASSLSVMSGALNRSDVDSDVDSDDDA
jgi:hypothetical protein